MSCGTLLQVLGLMRVMWNVVAGTGTNACYMEHLDKVLTWDGDFDEPKRVS